MQEPAVAPDRGVARRQAFLRTARAVFLEQGYEAACVNDVVRLAGGSLATLYAQFNSKEGLFFAVAQEQHEQFVGALTPPDVDGMSLERGLRAIGERFLAALLEPENLAFFRILVGEGRKFPQLLRRYLFSGPDRILDVVSQHLRRTAPDIADPDQVASFFLEMVRSRHHYRALADESYKLADAALQAHVCAAVEFLLRGARAR